ncbi:MAG TPA: hypothetical protein VF591_21725 [Pyrinomonadaceae bacterium]|jgi:hypothetical protein
MSADYQVTYVNDQRRLAALAESLLAAPALALDIETASWWDPRAERVSLIQLAYREAGRLKVAVVDALAGPDVSGLRRALESGEVVKAAHNASFDTSRLHRHFGMRVSPVHDTMLAARRAGERGCSLRAQAERHLWLRLDKGPQQSDWSARPLHPRQIAYAALDAAATLLLYEHQTARGLRGEYRPRAWDKGAQGDLPLAGSPAGADEVLPPTPDARGLPAGEELNGAAVALLGVIVEVPSRYGPERLAASVGEDRVGLAGWIIDRVLGAEAEIDEEVAKEAIAHLCASGLIRLTADRRLEASAEGREAWLRRKPA